MDILQAARIARPGTAWNLRGNVLEQAIDGTLRVSVPKQAELDAIIAADTTAQDVAAAKVILKNPLATADQKVDALTKILGI